MRLGDLLFNIILICATVTTIVLSLYVSIFFLKEVWSILV